MTTTGVVAESERSHSTDTTDQEPEASPRYTPDAPSPIDERESEEKRVQTPSPLTDETWQAEEDVLDITTSWYDQVLLEEVPENRPKEIPQPEVGEPPVRNKTTNASTSNCTGARRKVPDAHPRANAYWTRRPPPHQDNTRRARRPYDPIPPYYQSRNVEKQANLKKPRLLPGTKGRPEFRPAGYMPTAARRAGTNQPPATVEPKTTQEHVRLREADWPEALRLKVADLRRRARLGEKFGRRGELHFEGDARYRIVVKAAGVIFVTKLPPRPSPST